MLKTCTTFLSVFSLVVFLSGVAVAAPAPGCNDGTQAGGNSGGIWGIMENQAKAMRVRDKAFSEAIHTQPDSVLATPCFEQSLILTSRLGTIFSDTIPQNVPARDDGIFGKVYTDKTGTSLTSLAADLGISKPLGTAISNVLDKDGSGVLTNYLNTAGNFANSLTAQMGYTATGALNQMFNTLLSGPFSLVNNALNGMISTLQSAMTTINQYATQISQIMNQVGGVLNTVNSLASAFGLDSYLQTFFSVFNTLDSVIQSAIDIKNDAFAAINNGVSSLQSIVSGFLGSLLSAATSMLGLDASQLAGLTGVDQRQGCNGLSDAWYGTEGNPGMKGKGGFDFGAPFLTYRDLINKTVDALPSNSPLMEQILSTGNSQTLNDAKNDLNNLLNAPGAGISSYKPAATIPNNASSGQIICIIRNLPYPC